MNGFMKAAAALMLMIVVMFAAGCKPEDSPNNGGGGSNGGGTYNGHGYVDLGLPSGTLWAICNVGANAPEEYGDYFAWGETSTKTKYNWSTYQLCDGKQKLIKYCNKSHYGYNGFTDTLTVLQPMDDAATANWGNGWCIPTADQWKELRDNTITAWTTQNGVEGRLLTALNRNTLFLPATGCRLGGWLHYAGSYGNYWSGSLNTDHPISTWSFYFYSDGYSVCDSCDRFYGFSVRPVRSSCQN